MSYTLEFEKFLLTLRVVNIVLITWHKLCLSKFYGVNNSVYNC